MTKECKVLLRNQYVMVVDFDGKEIQMPSDCIFHLSSASFPEIQST